MNIHTANVFLPGCLGPVKREVVLADEAQAALDEKQALSVIFYNRQLLAENKLKAALPDGPNVRERFEKAFRMTGYATSGQASELADLAIVIVRRLCQPTAIGPKLCVECGQPYCHGGCVDQDGRE